MSGLKILKNQIKKLVSLLKILKNQIKLKRLASVLKISNLSLEGLGKFHISVLEGAGK